MHSFDTNRPFHENYKFLIGSILPRPIAVVSTTNKDGSHNIAPFSFFTGVSASPMIVAFCPLIRTSTGEKKDTVINIEREKEFVINFVTTDTAEKINETSAEVPYGVDEFKLAGLGVLPSQKIKAPRLKESPIHFECRLKDILNYGSDPGCGSLITGEVVMVHVAEELYDNGRIDIDKFKPIGRGAGNDWILTDHRIQLERKMKAQIQK